MKLLFDQNISHRILKYLQIADLLIQNKEDISDFVKSDSHGCLEFLPQQ